MDEPEDITALFRRTDVPNGWRVTVEFRNRGETLLVLYNTLGQKAATIVAPKDRRLKVSYVDCNGIGGVAEFYRALNHVVSIASGGDGN